MSRGRDRDRAPEKPIYVGNFEYDASSREIEKLCEKYGDLERVDMKTG
jgi:arginine/serine-rich splicing factor 4/5/6